MFDIISPSPSHTPFSSVFLLLSSSAFRTHIHSEIGCLRPLSHMGKEGKNGGGIRTQRSRKKKGRSRTQRLAYRDSEAHSGGEHLSGIQVNQGHTVIVGGPHVETDLCSTPAAFPTLILQRKSVSVMEEYHLAASRYCGLNCIAAECCNRSQSSALSLAILL